MNTLPDGYYGRTNKRLTMHSTGIILDIPLQAWSEAKDKVRLSLWDECVCSLKEEKPNVIIVKNTKGIMHPKRRMDFLNRLYQLNLAGYETNKEVIPSEEGVLVCAILKQRKK